MDHAGKISAQTVIIAVVVIVIAYLGYQWYTANYGSGARVKFELAMKDGSTISIESDTNISIENNVLMYNDQRVNAIRAALYLKPSTGSTEAITISYRGTSSMITYKIPRTLLTINDTITMYWSTKNLIEGYANTRIADSELSLDQKDIPARNVTPGTFTWQVSYLGTASVGDVENAGSFSCTGSIDFTYETGAGGTSGFLRLTPTVKTGTFDIV